MTAHQFSEHLKQLFFEKLERKTGWGKEELKMLYMECEIEVLKVYLLDDKD